jgi:hypothetical protein
MAGEPGRKLASEWLSFCVRDPRVETAPSFARSLENVAAGEQRANAHRTDESRHPREIRNKEAKEVTGVVLW